MNISKKQKLGLNIFQDVSLVFGVSKKPIFTSGKITTQKPKNYLLPKIIEFLGYVPFELSNKSMGEKIMAYRKEHGLSQRKLAKLLFVDQTTIRNWERMKYKPSKKLLKSISEILV